MKDKIQYEKAENKLSIIEDLFLGLTEYNNLNKYNNNKRFNLRMNYFYDDVEKCYRYTFTLTRGLNNPKNILELRLQYKDKINDLIEEMIDRILNNDKLSYLSFGTEYHNITKKFSINMKNEVSLDFEIKDNEDLELYERIRDKYNNTTIIVSKTIESITEEEKDGLQANKASKTIEIIKNILDSLNEYNNLENYENTKPFKLLVTNVNEEDYTKFNFIITRGNYDNETIIDLSLSIKDTSVIYKELYEIMLDYVSKDEFIYNTINNSEYNKAFNIHLKNNLTLSFKIDSKKDEIFYGNFFNEYRHDILERQKNKELIK